MVAPGSQMITHRGGGGPCPFCRLGSKHYTECSRGAVCYFEHARGVHAWYECTPSKNLLGSWAVLCSRAVQRKRDEEGRELSRSNLKGQSSSSFSLFIFFALPHPRGKDATQRRVRRAQKARYSRPQLPESRGDISHVSYHACVPGSALGTKLALPVTTRPPYRS